MLTVIKAICTECKELHPLLRRKKVRNVWMVANMVKILSRPITTLRRLLHVIVNETKIKTAFKLVVNGSFSVSYNRNLATRPSINYQSFIQNKKMRVILFKKLTL